MRPPPRQHVRTEEREGDTPSPGGAPHIAADADGHAPAAAEALRRENEQLRHAVESRPVIDMARGVLIAGFGCRPEEAWEILVAVSQHANVKLRTVADAVAAAAAVQAWQATRENGAPG
ncbi:ANTAR domain-containing protein [Streptomyces sp. NBC_01788]|uniref:ANTAR domain-containing protein n=1 Tax=Streptomyces sp. NBC_01788 TaxID=2975940 RepID=UPI002DD94EB4|nr:ANTAR domain-containing protein [Streptomyces sp. NBC_01788]WSB30873.1 ANTAR domain-containing protein [Streptomyces sp. NBC_01788]